MSAQILPFPSPRAKTKPGEDKQAEPQTPGEGDSMMAYLVKTILELREASRRGEPN